MGPLSGIRIVEIGSIGPGPFAAMMLADMGADIVRLERTAGHHSLGSGDWNLTNRGRRSVGIDLKSDGGREVALELIGRAHALIEGFRPGVMEKLGLGPETAHGVNPRLVYGRMTGYGQDGPMAPVAGHDINYLSLAGALGLFQRAGERPLFPNNLVADYGGGGMMLAFGVVCALLEARASGRGQVVDAAMVEGTAVLSTLIQSFHNAGMLGVPGTNLLDSGAHFYEVYETADGGFIAVGAIEPQFYAELLRLMELDPDEFPQMEQARWPELKERFAARFRQKSRAEWSEILEPAEACATPVLSIEEARAHPHNVARGAFVEVDGHVQPAPAPRFSRTPGEIRHGARAPGSDTEAALVAWGLDADVVARHRASGALA